MSRTLLSAILIGPWCFEAGYTLFLVVLSIQDESEILRIKSDIF